MSMKGVALSFEERDIILSSLYLIESELGMLFFSQEPLAKEQQVRIYEHIHKLRKIIEVEK